MKKIIYIVSVIMATSSFAALDKLTSKDIMSKIDNGRINWDIEPAIKSLAIATLMKIGQVTDPRNIPEKLIRETEAGLIKQFKSQYVYFQPAMANVRYMQDSSWRYSITFDFATTRKCTLRVEKIDSACGNPVCNANATDLSNHPNVDINGTIIPDSYCEKLYSIKISPQGNLQSDSIGVSNEKK